MTLVENDYCWNRDFREYVDKYAKEHDITPEELLLKLVGKQELNFKGGYGHGESFSV